MVLQHPGTQFWGPAIGVSGKLLCVVYNKLVKSRLLQQLSSNRNIFKLILKLLRLYAADANWKQKSKNSKSGW